MTLPRIWIDFNAGGQLDRFGTRVDLKRQNLELKPGMRVQVYQDDYDYAPGSEPEYLVAEGVVRWDDKLQSWWVDYDAHAVCITNDPSKALPVGFPDLSVGWPQFPELGGVHLPPWRPSDEAS